MMKTMLLAGSMIVAAPALAQTAGHTGHATPQTASPAPTTGATPTQVPANPTPAPTTVAPPGTTPTPGATPSPSATPADPADPAAPDTAATASPTHTQVAQLVEQQFGSYDRNGDGRLDKAEFAAWMDALKTQANVNEPAAQRTAWNDAAFKQADGDKSASVTKTELTGFLVRGSTGQS